MASELESSTGNAQDKNRRSFPKSDGYKIKYRRNRLRQKLRELRGKALELSREMAACNNSADTNPQRSTRLRQMMNCYEKQIENISKLLCKLSASIPPTTDDIVDLDYENELDERTSIEKTAVDSDVAQVSGMTGTGCELMFRKILFSQNKLIFSLRKRSLTHKLRNVSWMQINVVKKSISPIISYNFIFIN